MENEFAELQDRIKKAVKGVHVSVLSESDIATNRFWLKTPALDLNRILSGSLNKGIQSRNLIAIIGPEHTFKSSFMILCMAEAQKQGKKCIIIDTEGGISSDFCTRWGLDTSKILYNYTPWVSEVKSIIAQIRETGDEDFVIGIDSIGGLDRLKSHDDALKGDPKSDQGLLQKEIRGTLKLLLNVCVAQNSIGIVTGHMYGMPGKGMPMPDQIGGGKAMKLFPSILIMLKKSKLLEGKNIVGSEITATTLKNRYYPPFQTASVQLNYVDGIKVNAGLLALGIEAGLVQLKGSWYNMTDGEKLGQGESNAMNNIDKKFIDKLDKWLKNTGYSTLSEEMAEASALVEEAEIIKKPTESEIPKKAEPIKKVTVKKKITKK
jgi:recombination protein RecA